MAAMAHQEVFQQQIIINQFIRGRLRGKEEPEYVASRETRQFCIYDQLSKEDPRTFQKSSAIQINHMMKYSIRPVTVSGNNIPETGSP